MTHRTPSVIGMTGASGFVGQAACQALAAAGYQVIALGRRPVAGLEHRSYDLSQPVPTSLLNGIEAVVHAGWDLSLTDSGAIAAVNVRGSEALARAAEQSGTRGILISSMSAYPGTAQIYGRAKLAAEAAFLAGGGEAVRVGLVWGGTEGGMIGTLRRLSKLPLVPLLARGARQFTVHVDDMAQGLVRLLEHSAVGEPVGLANPEPVPFEEILRDLRGERPPFIRIPWRPVYESLRLAERGGVPLPVRADSLLGLVRPAEHVPRADLWPEFGLSLRQFGAVMMDA
jgi:nucleoside-diphosphate-sugar epimerase